ncbi:MAG: hypothetical protein EOM35_08945 [Negativicutes bacterium]|nr:hypothetical protein [Negativicutes bacterium]
MKNENTYEVLSQNGITPTEFAQASTKVYSELSRGLPEVLSAAMTPTLLNDVLDEMMKEGDKSDYHEMLKINRGDRVLSLFYSAFNGSDRYDMDVVDTVTIAGSTQNGDAFRINCGKNSDYINKAFKFIEETEIIGFKHDYEVIFDSDGETSTFKLHI